MMKDQKSKLEKQIGYMKKQIQQYEAAARTAAATTTSGNRSRSPRASRFQRPRREIKLTTRQNANTNTTAPTIFHAREIDTFHREP